ncbi:Rad2 nuclease [Parahypoxylon ruwenzoriense]
MGIQGLLPLLKSVQRPTELKKYNGETFGVDAYGWLHRGAVSCAIELAQGKPTRKYVDFAMNRVRMAKHFGVTPYLVFDGGFLPSKGLTEASREKRREECKKAGLELLKAGKPSQAHLELQKAIDVTPEMARHLIEELKKAGVPYVVAPYEADPQLVYLERQGLISGIISEDSDLLVFGAKRLITKLDQHGQCIEINRRDFCACREVSLTGWTDAQFRQMAILSGCDYLDSINNLGLKTAHRMIRKHKTPERVIRMLQFDGKYRVPTDYLKLFNQAEQTFLYQWVFCPKANKLVNLTAPGPNVNVDELSYIGAFIEPEIARGIATGDVNPITKQKILLHDLPSPRKRTASGSVRAAPLRAIREPPEKPIDSFFKGHRRIPLGEMEPNCFSVDPARLSNMTENGNRPIVYPLPRPYLDEAGPSSSAGPRAYINRLNSPARSFRRRTEPISNLLSNGGRSLASASRRQTTGPHDDIRNNSDNAGTALVRPPKKARLCDDANSGLSPEREKSKFFPAGNANRVNSTKGEKYLMSDDSIEEALKDLPDLDGWSKSAKGQKEVSIYQEACSSSTAPDVTKDGEQDIEDGSCETSTSAQDSIAPHTPSGIMEHFVYVPSATSDQLINEHNASRRQSTSTSTSIRKSNGGLTPASSTSSTPFSSFTQPSTAKTTPATSRMTPLQRLGAQALGRSKQPPTPTFAAPRPPKRSSLGRPSLDSLPINPAFVPLPPVDLEEVEALHEPIGSEDLLLPESENDEPLEGQENLGKNKSGTRGKVDLSRFLFA